MANKRPKDRRSPRHKNVDIYAVISQKIWTELSKRNVWQRDAGMAKTIDEIAELMRREVDFDRTASKIKSADYDKTSLKHDLIREVQSGNAASAKLLADLEGWRTSGTDYLIVTVDYSELSSITDDELIERACQIDQIDDDIVKSQGVD